MVRRIVAFFRSFFVPPTCLACDAHKEHIETLFRMLAESEKEKNYFRACLFTVARIPAEANEVNQTTRPHLEPVATGGKTWRTVRSELERKHKRPTPEDRTEEYWTNKNAELEGQAGIKINGVEYKVTDKFGPGITHVSNDFGADIKAEDLA